MKKIIIVEIIVLLVLIAAAVVAFAQPDGGVLADLRAEVSLRLTGTEPTQKTEPPTQVTTQPTVETEPPTEQMEPPEEETEAPTEPEEETEPPTEPEVIVPVAQVNPAWYTFLPGSRLTARQYFVYDLQAETYLMLSGAPEDRIYPASITKLFTTYVALQYIDPEAQITVGDEIDLIDPDSSIAALKKGDVLTAEQLVAAMLLPSGNDASYVLTTYAGRLLAEDPYLPAQSAIDRFVQQMNTLAQELGLTGSHFVTPDGIHDEDHYFSVADLVTVSCLALNDPIISRYVATPEETVWLGESREVEWDNTNLLLHEDMPYYCDYAIGLKTGFTSAAGYCQMSAFRVEDRDLLIGVFGSADYLSRLADTLLLFAETFDLPIPAPIYKGVICPQEKEGPAYPIAA